MVSSRTTKQWYLASRPDGTPTVTGPDPTFKIRTVELPELEDGQVLVRVQYISNDAGLRTYLSCSVDNDRMYIPPIPLGEPMRAGIIGEVLESNAASFKAGDLVMDTHRSPWASKVVLDAANLQRLAPLPGGLSVTHYLGAFGGSGLAGYVGLLQIGEAKPEHTVLISAAAGATGSMAVQTAVRILGAKRVVGIAGGAEKCAWVRDYLGAHACVDYKSPTFTEDLKAATPDEVDVYFDNVGGAVLDAALARMKKHSTIAVCGAVSVYNSDKPMELRNWFEVVSQRITLKGFFLYDHLDKIPKAMEEVIAAAVDGRIKLDIEDVVPAKVEEVPDVWINMYSSSGKGKVITKLVE
jgi:NADPH-dependent curcumin reductase CurA